MTAVISTEVREEVARLQQHDVIASMTQDVLDWKLTDAEVQSWDFVTQANRQFVTETGIQPKFIGSVAEAIRLNLNGGK